MAFLLGPNGASAARLVTAAPAHATALAPTRHRVAADGAAKVLWWKRRNATLTLHVSMTDLPSDDNYSGDIK